MIKVATVFSGIGALEHALERQGKEYEVVFACDNGGVEPFRRKDEEEIKEIKQRIHNIEDAKEKQQAVKELYGSVKQKNFVKQSYFANYKIDESQWYEDIEFLDGKPYKGKVDLFVGGSPCQSFSLAGKRGGLEDARGTLFYEYARLVNEIEPKVFIYENVRGMINHDGGKTWETIKGIFDSLGYSYKFKLLNATDYGIPQTRRRIFVVGFKEEKYADLFDFPQEKELEKTMQDFLEENTKSMYYIRNLEKNKEQHITEKIEEKYFLSEKLKKTILSTGTKGFHREPTIDTPIAKTLLATMHKMHRAGVDNYVTTYGRLRKLTPKECLRLMGFCDSFEKVVSNTQLYKQAGNSIVVDKMMAVLESIEKTKVFE